MSNPTIIEKPKVQIEEDLLNELLSLTKEEKQVIVHCLFDSRYMIGAKIRIWPTTYLFDRGSSGRSELVHAENISMAPQWTEVENGSMAYFSLVFTGLPSSCTIFDLVEDIPQPGGFIVQGIRRNDQDVYFVML